MWSQGTLYLMRGLRSPTGRGTFEGEHVPTHCSVPPDESIAQCLSARYLQRTSTFAAVRGMRCSDAAICDTMQHTAFMLLILH